MAHAAIGKLGDVDLIALDQFAEGRFRSACRVFGEQLLAFRHHFLTVNPRRNSKPNKNDSVTLLMSLVPSIMNELKPGIVVAPSLIHADSYPDVRRFWPTHLSLRSQMRRVIGQKPPAQIHRNGAIVLQLDPGVSPSSSRN